LSDRASFHFIDAKSAAFGDLRNRASDSSRCIRMNITAFITPAMFIAGLIKRMYSFRRVID